jgi:hypothetical protein
MPSNTSRYRPDPYAGFKDDTERRRALIARDVRLVLITLIVAASHVPWADVAIRIRGLWS